MTSVVALWYKNAADVNGGKINKRALNLELLGCLKRHYFILVFKVVELKMAAFSFDCKLTTWFIFWAQKVLEGN